MNLDELTVGQLREITKLAKGIGCGTGTKAAARLEEKRVVLVIDRGWIFAGDQSLTSDGYIKLTNAVHVRSWSGIGFDGMLEQWKTDKVVLKKVADAEFPRDAVLFRVPVEAGWGIR